MRIKQPSDIPEYEIRDELWGMVSSFVADDQAEAQRAFASLYQQLKYHAPRHDVKFMVGLSNTDGRTAIRTWERRRGNPKIVIKGRRVPYHAHVIVAGANAKAFTKEMVTRRNKADGVKRTKSHAIKGYGNDQPGAEPYDDKGAPFIGYVFRQCEAIRSYPTAGLNFRDFETNFYRVAQE